MVLSTLRPIKIHSTEKKKKKKVLNGLFFAYLDVVHIKRKRKVKTKKEGFIP
jgi:hypothetical protein